MNIKKNYLWPILFSSFSTMSFAAHDGKLLKAVLNNDYAEAKLQIEQGANVNYVPASHNKSLMEISYELYYTRWFTHTADENYKIMQLLLSKEAKSDFFVNKNFKEYTRLCSADEDGRIDETDWEMCWTDNNRQCFILEYEIYENKNLRMAELLIPYTNPNLLRSILYGTFLDSYNEESKEFKLIKCPLIYKMLLHATNYNLPYACGKTDFDCTEIYNQYMKEKEIYDELVKTKESELSLLPEVNKIILNYYITPDSQIKWYMDNLYLKDKEKYESAS